MAIKRTRKAAAKTVEVMEKPSETSAAESRKPKARARREKPFAAAATAPEYYCVIDYPVDGETVSGLHYAVRIGATDIPGGYVEVQINGGPWSPARFADGFWWFDWGYFTAGPHKLQARLVDQEGKILKKSPIVKCQVV